MEKWLLRSCLFLSNFFLKFIKKKYIFILINWLIDYILQEAALIYLHRQIFLFLIFISLFKNFSSYQ
ncbi:unnamed protein product [Blepharisma stoltei]|uniref:Uncharacterized protein n=1 Tax=Blepharisma stoltei TaxID=1481888 RepID=A0AAU9IXJ3_9CILI|nr:unnamed protein product [Blepharisma stoltei]